MNTNDEGGMMHLSIQAVILMPSECEREADDFIHRQVTANIIAQDW